MKNSEEVKKKPLFNVYDYVWIMRGNHPYKMQVFAVIESMSYWKTSTEIYYNLVGSTLGAGWGNNEGDQYSADQVFRTKEDLLESLK